MEASVERFKESSSEKGANTSKHLVFMQFDLYWFGAAAELQKVHSNVEQGSEKENIQARNFQSAEENVFSQGDRNVVSEEEESQEGQDNGNEPFPPSLDETELEMRTVKTLAGQLHELWIQMEKPLRRKNKRN